MKDVARRLRRGLINLWRRELLGDHPLREAQRWKRAGGVRMLHRFPVPPDEAVLDIGGHIGGFAAAIHGETGAEVHLFEPVARFQAACEKRFAGNSRIHVHGFGLGEADGRFAISDANEASSLFAGNRDGGEMVEVRAAGPAVAALGIARIGLVKMNIEGAEYQVLPALLDAGIVARSRFLLIQFHTVGDWVAERERLRRRLAETHDEIWCYEFVWEAWQRRADA
jgi:FkbM family methyltransferase